MLCHGRHSQVWFREGVVGEVHPQPTAERQGHARLLECSILISCYPLPSTRSTVPWSTATETAGNASSNSGFRQFRSRFDRHQMGNRPGWTTLSPFSDSYRLSRAAFADWGYIQPAVEKSFTTNVIDRKCSMTNDQVLAPVFRVTWNHWLYPMHRICAVSLQCSTV